MDKMEVLTTQFFSRKALSELWERRGEFDMTTNGLLTSLYNNRKKGSLQGQQDITYRLSKSKAGQLGFGRLYGQKSSLEHLQNECRATLCSEYYHDVDIVNAQPTLLAQLVKKELNEDMPNLDYYIDNRDDILKGLMEQLDITRDDAKEEIIRILYGGSTKIPQLVLFSEEVRSVAKRLSRLQQYTELFASLKHEKNIYGSFLAHVTQTAERECMLAMRDFLMSEGWSVDVLAYDGVMIRKREGKSITVELLTSLSDSIEEKTGYSVRIIEKPMHGFNTSEEEVDESKLEIAEGVSYADYAAMKEEFEKTHFYHAGNSKVCSYNAVTNQVLQLTKEQATENLIQWRFRIHKKQFKDDVLFIPLWMKDDTRRTVDAIEMGEPTDNKRIFRIPFVPEWVKYSEVVSNVEAVPLFRDFLSKLVPDDNMRELLIEWMAHILQKPFDNSKTCLVLAGGKGCGKDTLGDFFGEWILGSAYYQNYDSTEQFWNPYDTGRFAKIMVKLEEAMGSLNRQHEAAFKARITSQETTVNPKGLPAMTIPNYTRYLLTTNEASPVKLDEHERRFAIIHCGSELMGNLEYWKELRRILFCKEGAKAVAQWLMSVPTGDFPRMLPKSSLHLGIIENEKTSEERFVSDSEEWEEPEMKAAALFTEYKIWCARNGESPTVNSKWFGRNLSQLCLEGKLLKRVVGGYSLYRKPGTALGGAGGF